MLQKRWVFNEKPEDAIVDELQLSLGIDRCLCVLLCQRGITDFESAKKFFRPSLELIHDPFLMKNMDRAIERIEIAFQQNERILIYGDYDVDGTTAVAMVFSYFQSFTKNIDFYVPDRYAEGYGISYQSINWAAENGFSLVIALDCGIKAVEKIEYAKQLGIDYIVCDHHLPGDQVPNGIILNPKQVDCNYPFPDLSGAGVGYKLLQAYSIKNKLDSNIEAQFIDLLAISIGADMVPIKGENRAFTQFGLKKLNNQPNRGIQAILNQAKVRREINMRDIGFLIGPRINAAGRIDHARKAVELLITNCDVTAESGSENVNVDNSERKILEAETTKEALTDLNSNNDHQSKKSTVVFNEKWNKGVLGIVANRIQEYYYRPTIVLTKSGDFYTGSCRSVKKYNIYDAVNSCSDLLESFGGHAFAAGLTIKPENLHLFAQRFEEYVASTIEHQMLTPSVEVDIEFNLNSIDARFFKILNQFEPFGEGNNQPLFVSRNLRAAAGVRVVGKDHLKFEMCEEKDPSFRFSTIAFNQINHYDWISRGKPFDAVYTIEINEWNGSKNLQLNIKDIKVDC